MSNSFKIEVDNTGVISKTYIVVDEKIDIDNERKVVASINNVYTKEGELIVESKTIASLFAAAPKMLEMLKNALQELADHKERVDLNKGWELITKAEGRESNGYKV